MTYNETADVAEQPCQLKCFSSLVRLSMAFMFPFLNKFAIDFSGWPVLVFICKISLGTTFNLLSLLSLISVSVSISGKALWFRHCHWTERHQRLPVSQLSEQWTAGRWWENVRIVRGKKTLRCEMWAKCQRQEEMFLQTGLGSAPVCNAWQRNSPNLTISHICFPCFPLQHRLGQGIWWVGSTDLQRSFSVVSAPCVEHCKADTNIFTRCSHGVHTVFALSHERYGVPVDVWALACTLYEIFTGKTLLQASQQVLALCVLHLVHLGANYIV